MGRGLNPFRKTRAAGPHNNASVAWSPSYWESHILARHPEMKDHEDEAVKTISDPLAIYQSDTHAARHVFYRPSGLPSPFHGGFIRVIVEYDKRGKGLLITAHHAWEAKARETVMLWPVS